MKKTIISLTALGLLNLASCKKNTSSSNNNNASTKQQISMLINGVPYSVTTGESGVTQSDAHIAGSNNRFQLDATKGKMDFSVNTLNVVLNSENTIKNGTSLSYAQWEDGTNIFTQIGTSKGFFKFTLSNKREITPNNFLVEGSFNGVLYNTQKTDSVTITNGQIKFVN